MNRTRWILAALFVVPVASAFAQSRHGARDVMPRDKELALARSAAPTAVSEKARVWVWTGRTYAIGDSGTSSVNCFVARNWVPSVEPHCMDEEASATILPIFIRKIELYAQGKSDADVERDFSERLARGEARLPSRPAVTYMMSEVQELVNGQGAAVGPWQPHLMIYYPRLTGEQTGLLGFVPGIGFVENPGTPLSALIIPLKSFVPLPK